MDNFEFKVGRVISDTSNPPYYNMVRAELTPVFRPIQERIEMTGLDDSSIPHVLQELALIAQRRLINSMLKDVECLYVIRTLLHTRGNKNLNAFENMELTRQLATPLDKFLNSNNLLLGETTPIITNMSEAIQQLHKGPYHGYTRSII